MDSEEETELIRKAKEQNQNAYNILFDKYWNFVYSYLSLRTSDINVAEEIAIESFAKAFDRLDQYDEQHSFSSWLITIAKNHHVDRYRKSKKQFEKYQDIEKTSPLEFSSSNVPSPEELMIANQNLDKVLDHIKSMKKEYRDLLRMRYFENLSLKEIEKILKEPSTTIRVKLFREKKMLANLLQRDAH